MAKKQVNNVVKDFLDDSAKVDDALAKATAVEYLKQAIGQSAEIDGALVTLVTILLKENMGGTVTAGISGIQNADKSAPSFWSGGTYADAISGVAGIIFRHNSTGKIGVFDVGKDGLIRIFDTDTPTLERLRFHKNQIETAAAIYAGGSESGSVQNNGSLGSTTGTTTLPNTITVSKNGVELTVAGTAYVNAVLDMPHGYTSGVAEVIIKLYKNGVYYSNVETLGSELNTENNIVDLSYAFSYKYTVPAGTYSIVVERVLTNCTISSVAGLQGTSSMSKLYNADVRRAEFGNNGFMMWYQNNHFHFTEANGLDVRGATNMPGVLAAGSSTSGGTQSNVWGAKSSTAGVGIITGGFRVPLLNLTHNEYVIQITPHTNTTFRVGTKTNTYFDVYGTGGFDYVVIGKNYA